MKEPLLMLNRRHMLQTGAALVAGSSICLEEMLQAQQARENPVTITAVKAYLLKGIPAEDRTQAGFWRFHLCAARQDS